MMKPMNLHTDYGLITVTNEPTHSFNSTDNRRCYASEIPLTDSIGSNHGVSLNGELIVVVGAGGGATDVHAHSALVIEDTMLLAVGNHIACISIVHPYRLLWSLQVDVATCFGIYWQSQRGALIAHGELAISRFPTDGRLIWQAWGADIFTEGFDLLHDHIRAVDFDQSVYRFDYDTGELLT
ncbi:hypothetical protein COO64_08565 [Pseudomonas donghuensis]|nr:hypothetical protein COO64_08565 [Pseudomonas donghuensis]